MKTITTLPKTDKALHIATQLNGSINKCNLQLGVEKLPTIKAENKRAKEYPQQKVSILSNEFQFHS